jgi:hypothetical protein
MEANAREQHAPKSDCAQRRHQNPNSPVQSVGGLVHLTTGQKAGFAHAQTRTEQIPRQKCLIFGH